MFLGKRRICALILPLFIGLALTTSARSEIGGPPRPAAPFSVYGGYGPTLAGMVTPRLRGADLARELRCLALNVYWEARSESTAGQIAVAMVTLNRVAHSGFPGTVCGVVHQGGSKRAKRCQFTWYCDGRKDEPNNAKAWRRAQAIAYRAVFHGLSDPTRGALWYHADYVHPRWTRSMRRTARIGRHVYYSES